MKRSTRREFGVVLLAVLLFAAAAVAMAGSIHPDLSAIMETSLDTDLIPVFILAHGQVFGSGEISSIAPEHGQSTDDIILISLGTWVVTGAKTPRGIDCSDSVSEIYITDYSTDMIGVYDYTGAELDHIACPTEVPDVAGIC